MALQTRQEQTMETRQAAADELFLRLKSVADALIGDGMRPKRIVYGPQRAGGLLKHRSPRGLLLYAAGPRLHMLLPDGRLWHYHERRNVEGIYYDARTDHARSQHGAIPLNGGWFSFLGAVVGKYHFGYREGGDLADSPDGFELGAIIGRDATSPQYFEAAEAFTEIIRSL